VTWSIEDRTVIVTGANSGIGLATAEELARRGANVFLAVRDPDLGRAAAERITATTGRSTTTATIDLASFASIRSFADRFTEEHGRTDVLINNAGVFMGSRRQTADGFETTMGVNHLGPFLLTCLLASDPASAPARIVTVASAMHSSARPDPGFQKLATHGRYSGTAAYARSKLANILFTGELARRLSSTESVAFSAHPGMVATRIAGDGDSRIVALAWKAASRWLQTPAQGASTSVYLATEPGIEHLSGAYFVGEHTVEPSPAARDERVAARLWSLSTEATGCEFRWPQSSGTGTVSKR